MAPNTVYSLEDKAQAYLQLGINQGNVGKTARELEIPKDTLRGWKNAWERDGVPDDVVQAAALAQEGFISRATKLRDRILAQIETKVDGASFRDLSWTLGVLTDKIDRAKSLEIRQPNRGDTNVQINVFDREQAQELFESFVVRARDDAKSRQESIQGVIDQEQAPKALLPGKDDDG